MFLHVERRADLPRTPIAAGTLAAHGLEVPLPPGAEADAHDDLRDVGGEDCHDLRVPEFTLADMLALYLPWATAAGLELTDRVEGLGDCALFLRRPGRGSISIRYYASRKNEPPTLRLAFADAHET